MRATTGDPEILGVAKGAFVVGESLVDITVDAGGTERHRPGGSPMNVAFGLARMGVSARLLTTVGDDAGGRQILRHLQGARVKLDDVRVVPGVRTSSARAMIGADGAASYSFDLSWDISGEIEVPTDCGILHTGSIGAVLEPGADAVLDLFLSAPPGVVRAYDPNARPSITPDRERVRERVERLVENADVVKMSEEDAAWLLPDEDGPGVVRWALDRGVKFFVLTRGADGCLVQTPSRRVDQPAFPPVKVVDTIGAGDAFMAALLAGMSRWGLLEAVREDAISPGDVERLAVLASRAASMTVSQVGAHPPTWAQVRSVA